MVVNVSPRLWQSSISPIGGDFVSERKNFPFPSAEDLLVMSCTHSRLRNPPFSTYINGGFSSHTVIEHIQQKDRELADKIRDHFSKKIMMLVLRGSTITEFRRDLNIFLHMPSKNEATEDLLPLISRLPDLYQYDTEFEEMCTALVPVKNDIQGAVTVNLTPKKQFLVKTKDGMLNEYWLADEEQRGCRIKLIGTPATKSLLPLWEREFAKPRIKIACNLVTQIRDGFSYYLVTDWTIISC